MEIKNLTKAAARIRQAAVRLERIILYGDADLDGISSLIILGEAIKSLGGTVAATTFPNREHDGYGLTPKALAELKHLAPALLIVADLGIGNFEEVKEAKKLGFEVIIIDHHEILGRVPVADIVVDPKQPGDEYPFKGFAACGLAFLTAKAMLGSKLSPALERSFLELAALGTVADMMPRQQDNLLIIEQGMDAFFESWRPGIRAFLEREEELVRESRQVAMEQMVGLLNVRDMADGYPGGFRLLTTQSMDEARAMVEDFSQKTKIRRERVRQLAQEVRKRIALKKEEPLVFEGDESFDYELLGSVASIITNQEAKPVFLFKKRKEGSLGSARASSGFNTVQAMEQCKDLLERYGGHSPASGFRLKNENLEKFNACLADYFKTHVRI
ncbi:MAG: DHH family phosphoesterase [Parcubacteria group bacterium]|nr:DHH family phosphoesterase [Parcubacteria group bacterium]